jgi:ubiquinone biosynthesis monooxygenase Coq7
MTSRNYSPTDQVLIGFDQAVRTLFGRPQVSERPNPAAQLAEEGLSAQEQDQVARLMRINHTGEVCAQALYQGQALTAKLPAVRSQMERAAQEENDHLDWCDTRLQELDQRKSLLNPLWYTGAFTLGALAGLAGDRWSLGFVAETERQVESHLAAHLEQIPPQDFKSRAILEQMQRDEIGHANLALAAGGAELPGPIKLAMRLASKVMTTTVYWI